MYVSKKKTIYIIFLTEHIHIEKLHCHKEKLCKKELVITITTSVG